MTIAIYARVSKDDGKQNEANQLQEIREYAARQGWTIYKEYTDRASGKSADRPQFQHMFEDARLKHFDKLMFWSLDRLSREGTLETLKHLQLLDSYGVGWLSLTEQFFDSAGPFKDAVISIMATLAKMERLKISERTKAGLKRAVREGKQLGRPSVHVNTREIQRLQSSGLGLRGIAKETGISLSTIMKALKTNRLEAAK